MNGKIIRLRIIGLLLLAMMAFSGYTVAKGATPSGTIVEDFETGLGNNWTIDRENQAQISANFAHSGKQSLKITHVTSQCCPEATLQFTPLQACVIEFWLYIFSKGLRFSGWDDIGFGWEPLAKTEWHYSPVLINLLWNQSIEAMTLKKPPPPKIDVASERHGDWIVWTLTQIFPVREWFKIRMVIHVNRHTEFFIGDKHAGTVPTDTSEPIKGIRFGGGLSLNAMHYIVYLDDVRVSPLREESTPSTPTSQ